MGSAISSAIAAAAAEWMEHRPFLHELPLDQQERIVERWMEKMESKPYVSRGPWSDKDIALPEIHSALHHYNSNNPGAPFDLVAPMRCNHVGFRDEIWFHVNFLARPRPTPCKKRNFWDRRRNALPEADMQYFFAELHYGRSDTPVVETCTILETPLNGCKQKCVFCKGAFGILHPRNGEFVCGRPGQKKELYQISMWRQTPKKYLVPEEDPTSVQRLFDELPLAA